MVYIILQQTLCYLLVPCPWAWRPPPRGWASGRSRRWRRVPCCPWAGAPPGWRPPPSYTLCDTEKQERRRVNSFTKTNFVSYVLMAHSFEHRKKRKKGNYHNVQWLSSSLLYIPVNGPYFTLLEKGRGFWAKEESLINILIKLPTEMEAPLCILGPEVSS